MEINIRSLRVAKQVGLRPEEYSQIMFQELESADDDRIMALENIKMNKEKVAKSYNKKVKRKQFAEGNIIWKAILPIGTQDPRIGKCSPSWEGPCVVSQVIYGGVYRLVDMQGREASKNINRKFLKKYHPSIWETIQNS